MKFLCLAYPDRGFSPGPGLVAEYAALGEAMRAAGVLADSGQLSPGEASKLVRVTDGRADVSDGPPPGSGRQPSAYFVIDCPDLNAALGWAARIPARATARSKSARPDNCQHQGKDHARLHCLPHRHP
jgi:hypothetical protein